MPIRGLTLDGHSRQGTISGMDTWADCNFIQVRIFNLERSAFHSCAFQDCFIIPGNSFFKECVFIRCNKLELTWLTFSNCVQKEPAEMPLMEAMHVE